MSPDEASPSVVTGASGFVGRALAARLGESTRPLALSGEDWRARIESCSWQGAVVFHLAARVHVAGAQEASRQVQDNAEKTRFLAQAASRAGARRFVFLSTIKVNGEETAGRAFRAGDAPAPADAYARSKWMAEQSLAEIARDTQLEVVVVRSPLVVGPGAAGNLRALLRLVDSPWPLPFASIDNRRTLVALADLVELLRLAAVVPQASGHTLLAGAGEAVSTPRIVAVLRAALGRAPREFAMPVAVLEALGGVRMLRLTRSLEVDTTQTTQVTGWKAAVPIEEALAEMACVWRR
jgi:nucleoside-diphosphate-sugar epimerase